MITLSKLFIHPIKSMRSLQLSQAQATSSGLAFDRLLMITAPDGTFITARQYPQMVMFTPALLPDGISLTAPDNNVAVVRWQDFATSEMPTEVWGNHFSARVAPEAINQWLSQYLQREVQLRWQGNEPNRRVKRYPEIALSFADGYPYLLVNESSLRELQQRCPTSVRIEQFRPNLVVSGAPAFAEDSWQTVRIGEVVFDLVKPCSRCVLITINPQQGHKHPDTEPLKTLQAFRCADNGEVDFGINMIARNSGTLRQGDNIEVLATKSPRHYRAGAIVKNLEVPAITAQSVQIEYQGKRFTGNNQHILLEQLEMQGFRIPYSCRAGICGTCRLTLKEGEITALKQNSLMDDGTIMTCSCIPRSDIKLG